MTELPLQLKYRPETFEEVVGNEKLITSLRATLEQGAITTFLIQSLLS